MRTPHVSRYAASLAAVVLLGSLTACNDKEPASSTAPTSPATSTTTSEPTGTTEPTQSAEPTGTEIDPADFIALVSGGLDGLTTAHVSMAFDAGAASVTATGEVNYTGDHPDLAMTLKSKAFGKSGIQVRLIDNVMYMQLPMAGLEGKFVKVDLNDPNSPFSKMIGNLDSYNPRSTLDLFTKGLTKVVDLGKDTVNGVSSRHYRLTANGKAYARYSHLTTSMGVKIPRTLTYNMWLDADGRATKVVAGLPGSGTMTMVMGDWGAPVHIEVPPKRQIQEFPAN